MFKRILIGLDGSAVSERSIPWVKHLGAAEVVLARFGGGGLESLADRFTPRARVIEREGEAAPGLIEAAYEVDADLIAVTTQGASAPHQRAFGGTTERLLQEAAVPLLVVPASLEKGPRAGRPRRLVVPLDGSEFAARILPLAEALAREHDAEIVLTHIVTSSDADGRFRDEWEARLSSMTETYDVRYGDATEGILAVAKERRADYIVMAAHGLGALPRLIFGSVASAVLRRGVMPVIVARDSAMACFTPRTT